MTVEKPCSKMFQRLSENVFSFTIFVILRQILIITKYSILNEIQNVCLHKQDVHVHVHVRIQM